MLSRYSLHTAPPILWSIPLPAPGLHQDTTSLSRMWISASPPYLEVEIAAPAKPYRLSRRKGTRIAFWKGTSSMIAW